METQVGLKTTALTLFLNLFFNFLLATRGGQSGGGRGGTGHPWDFNISETGDTLSPNPVTHLSLSEDTQPQK